MEGTKEEDVIQPHISEAEYTTSAQSVVIDADDEYYVCLGSHSVKKQWTCELK